MVCNKNKIISVRMQLIIVMEVLSLPGEDFFSCLVILISSASIVKLFNAERQTDRRRSHARRTKRRSKEVSQRTRWTEAKRTSPFLQWSIVDRGRRGRIGEREGDQEHWKMAENPLWDKQTPVCVSIRGNKNKDVCCLFGFINAY